MRCESRLRPHPAQRLEQIRDRRALRAQRVDAVLLGGEQVSLGVENFELACHAVHVAQARKPQRRPQRRDRKSTRLNSSHGYISYAVFCLKKKKNTKNRTPTSQKKTQQKY